VVSLYVRYTHWCVFIFARYTRNVDDNIVTRGARLDEAMERLTNWNIIMKSLKLFYRVPFLFHRFYFTDLDTFR